MLVKLAYPGEALPNGAGFAVGGVQMRKLFTCGPPAEPGMMASAGPRHGWYAVGEDQAGEDQDGESHKTDAGAAWDSAHAMLQDGLGVAGAPPVAMVEPDLLQPDRPEPEGRGAASAGPAKQMGSPYVPGPEFAWHLNRDHTGLAAARDSLGVDCSPIKIVHLDTGFDRGHPACPAHILQERSFVPSKSGPNCADDLTPSGDALCNRGHGTGTLGILAGPVLRQVEPREAEGVMLGAAAPMQVVPVRIANSVVKFWTSAVAQGIDYAREIGADVVSMSMGGLPSAAWADAVNAAYDAGIVVVCAAGNNFSGLPTSLTVYPARFGRVIAACGAMANRAAYFHIPGSRMQGNVGPGSKMRTAMAAFTPNIPWPRIGTRLIDADGAGTSAATPQLAAAAALWLHRNGGAYPRTWQRAEAARQALFRSAARAGGLDALLGQGLLRAPDALAMVPPLESLVREPADSASFAFLHLLSSVFGVGEGGGPVERMLALELTQQALLSGAAQEAVPDPDLPAAAITEPRRRRFLEAVLDERKSSVALTRFLTQALGRRPASRAAGPVPAPAQGPPCQAAPPPLPGAPETREMLPPPPPSRRLRIFATDPGDGRRLRTAFINTAVVEVPWERGPGTDNLLQPGPVGEYLEVVDVDPPSAAAYAPVDLNDPFLLAQDGLSPSEGTPQFHQQMAYAVAMRTIGTFERALGRRALWASRRVERGSGAGYRDAFVRRLRVYPHALRGANAYYSPERMALLFGYFPVSTGRRIVFTCLSHDVIAHETTHALLDGLHRRYKEASNPDVHAFHEGFADIIAVFQHFTFPELLRFAITEQRGRLDLSAIMGELAREFGATMGRDHGLRSAIGKPPELTDYAHATEPHERGAVLVAAVFEAFLAIYARRTADLLRLATGGSGVLRPGALHPDLVDRLATEATKTARHILAIAIRALDYMPPVDPTFPEYLRAMVTADSDLVPFDRFGYRVALLEAFGRRGIQPDELRTLSEESLRWQTVAPSCQPPGMGDFLRKDIDLGWDLKGGRRESWNAAKTNARNLHDWLQGLSDPVATDVFSALGLERDGIENGIDLYQNRRTKAGLPPFEVHSVRPARRATPDGEVRTDIVAVITQKRVWPDGTVRRGGCTLILDRRENVPQPIRYAVVKPVCAAGTATPSSFGQAAQPLYFGTLAGEPFAMLHAHAG